MTTTLKVPEPSRPSKVSVETRIGFLERKEDYGGGGR